jgi:hypothetical protein
MKLHAHESLAISSTGRSAPSPAVNIPQSVRRPDTEVVCITTGATFYIRDVVGAVVSLLIDTRASGEGVWSGSIV